MKVYVARWRNPYLLDGGTVGVYSERELAEAELERCAPHAVHDVEAFDLDAPGLPVDESSWYDAEEMATVIAA